MIKIYYYTLLLKMVLHLNQPEIQFIGLLEFVSDEYLCCSNRSYIQYSRTRHL
jgi:hypothetical protein